MLQPQGYLPMDTLLSVRLLLKPAPETVSLVPPNKEPASGKMLCTSRMYSMVAFSPLLCKTKTGLTKNITTKQEVVAKFLCLYFFDHFFQT